MTKKQIKTSEAKKPVKKVEFHLNLNLKNIVIGLIIIFVIFSMFGSINGTSSNTTEQPFTSIIADIKEQKVKTIEVEDSKLTAVYSDGKKVISYKEPQDSLYSVLEKSGVDPKSVEIKVKDFNAGQLWMSILSNVLPLILTVVFFLFLFKQARGAQDNVFSFGQSKAKLWNKDLPKITFADVAGVDEAKNEVVEIVDFLKNPAKYKALGARTPKGVILVGPSGTGKTLLAKAMAGEAKVPFYSIAGSEFMEMLVGVGAARVRDLFSTAKKTAPAIIFIDEIDAIGRMRSVGAMGGHDEREQTLNQILVEMDGFEPNTAVLVVAATNRGDLLDPALTRPGRFDRRVTLDLPDMEGRRSILKIHAKGKPFATGVDWDKVSKRTVGFSGADLENMLNESAIHAARAEKKVISYADIEESATKVKLGPEKKRLQSDTDRKMTACHEAGHAVVNYHLMDMDRVHRISIISRGMALGYTLTPPEKDRLHETKSHLINQIATMMGGRAAESLIYKDVTSGAASDIDQATRIARYMVMEFGMSPLGPVNFGPNVDVTEWGKSLMDQQQISPEMLGKIDAEIQKFVFEGYETAANILKKYKKQLESITKALVEKETLEGEEFEELMKNS
ncbi:MAG: ATP-dependent zinc metalloprotease FtsH [Microgenomates group bacterium]